MARPRSDIEPRIVHAARRRFLKEGVDGASLRTIAKDAGTSIGMVYAANFSIGVQLFYRLSRAAAEIFADFPMYQPYIHESHHRMKMDAPSGTAIELKRHGNGCLVAVHHHAQAVTDQQKIAMQIGDRSRVGVIGGQRHDGLPSLAGGDIGRH